MSDLVETVPESQICEMAQPVVAVEDGDIPPTQEAPLLKCSKCGLELTRETLSAPQFQRQKNLSCKICRGVAETLRRNLGEFPKEWDLLNPSEQIGFWRQAVALKQDEGGVLRYKLLRSLLCRVISSSTIHEKTSVCANEYRPLSYWEKLGYCSDDIEEKADSRPCSIVGTVYAVPVHMNSEAVTYKHIEETILRCERDCKRRHEPKEIVPAPPKKAKKGEKVEAPTPIPLTEKQLELKEKLVDLTDLRSDSEDEAWKNLLTLP